MPAVRPAWLTDLSRQFKRHRQGRPGWFLEEHRDRLRLRSDEFPPRPGVTARRQVITLATPPGPASAARALAEACEIFDAVIAGAWRWPLPGAAGEDARLSRGSLSRLVSELELKLVGERVSVRTWRRTYQFYLLQLIETAGTVPRWADDAQLIIATLQNWPPNSRARQMAHDRIRAAWNLAGWTWPAEATAMRGNGRAAAAPDGVRAFTDAEISELRQRVQRSRLTPTGCLSAGLPMGCPATSLSTPHLGR